MCPATGPSLLKFGPFQVDLDSGELFKNETRLRLQEKSVRVLTMLAERQGQLVSREELKKRLWADDTFVDFEAGLNTAVAKLRSALSDDAANPRFIETIPRRGYRFLVPVEFGKPNGFPPSLDAPNGQTASAAVPPPSGISTEPFPAPSTPTVRTRQVQRIRPWLWVGTITLSAAIVALVYLWLFYGHSALSFSQHDSVLVTDFENQTGDPRFDEALRTAFTVSLEQSRHADVFPEVRIPGILRLMNKAPTERITPQIGREICQRENIRGLIAGSITRTGQQYAISVRLIDPQTGATARSYEQRSEGEDHILDALDSIAAEIRRNLGESLYQIHRANRPLPEVTTRSLEALKQYADGTELWHQGRFKEAITLLRDAVQKDPDFAMAHEALGVAYFSYLTNDPAHGKQEYDKALASANRITDRERLIIEASYADDLGHVDEADALYRSYLSRYPDDRKMLLDYARLLRLHERSPEAIVQYKQILRVAPDDAKTYVDLATAYRSLNDLPGALAAYSEAFRIDPHWLTAGDISREYGSTLMQAGHEEEASKNFTEMLEKPATRESGMRSLGMLDLYHGRYASAKNRFEQCLLSLAQQQAPLSKARVHLWLASVAEGQGDLRGELQELEAARAQFKDLGSTSIFGSWLGVRYARAHAIEEGIRIETVISGAADSQNSEQMSFLHMLQGEIAVAQGNADRSIELLTLANKEKTSALTIEALAHAYQQAGKMDDAIVWYEKLLNWPLDKCIFWEPQQWWLAAHYALASDYLARGDREKSKQTIGLLLDLWKDADPNLPLKAQSLLLSHQAS